MRLFTKLLVHGIKRTAPTIPRRHFTDLGTALSTLSMPATTILHEITVLNLEDKIAAVGLGLTFVQFYLSDRQAKAERLAEFEDRIGALMARLENLASQMDRMRREAISPWMVGHEFITMNQKIQEESEATLIQLRNLMRRLKTITLVPEVFYGPGFWNVTRSIERDAALTKWRLATLITCNQLIISHKLNHKYHAEQEFNSWPAEPENARKIRYIVDQLQTLISGDVLRLKHALEADVLDTQLAILTNSNLPNALLLIINKILPAAQKNKALHSEPIELPMLNRLSSFCLRAAANNLPFSSSFLALMQQLYEQNKIIQPFMEQMASSEHSDLNKWHAAAKFICHLAKAQMIPGMKIPSAVPAGILGIIALREAQTSGALPRDALLQNAVNYLDEAITTGPFRAYYRVYRAHAEYLRMNHELALDDIQRALEEDPDNAQGHMMNALLLLERGELQEAQKEASWHTRIPDTNPFVLRLVYEIMAKLRYAQKKTEEGAYYDKLAKEITPQEQSAISSISWQFFSKPPLEKPLDSDVNDTGLGKNIGL